MGNVASASSDESSILILCSLEWSPTQFVLQCDQWFHDGLIFFFHYLLLLKRTVSPPHIRCLFFFALHLEWSININTDKRSNAIANLCSTLFSLWSKFYRLGPNFCQNAQKSRQKLTGKNFNVDRQFFKDVIRIF